MSKNALPRERPYGWWLDRFGATIFYKRRRPKAGGANAFFLMRIAFFLLLLAGVAAISWWRGRSDERSAAAICVLGAILTVVTRNPMPHRFASVDLNGLLVDVIVLLAFLAIALRSDRFWPLWVAGLQLTATSVHLLKALNPDLMRFVFGAALAFWSYPILILIAVGAWRTKTVERWRAEQAIAGSPLKP